MLHTSACVDPNSASEGYIEEKPASFASQTLNQQSANPSKLNNFANAQYEFTIESNSGLSLCNGTFNAILNSEYTLSFESSAAKCGEVSIDIAKILRPISIKQLVTESSLDTDDDSGIDLDHDGSMLYLKSVGDRLIFSPPRPLLFGPFIFDQNEFLNYSKTQQTTVKVNEADFRGESKGTYTSKVVSINSPFDEGNEPIVAKFNNTIHWQITAEGFNDLPDKYGLLIPNFELWFSSSPLMIPRIRVAIDSKAILAEDAGNETAQEENVIENFGDLVGVIKIDFKLKDFNILGDESK